MANCDGSICLRPVLHGEQSKGFSDDEASTDDDDVLAFKADTLALANFNDARWRTGNKTIGIFLDDAPCVDDVESVDVFCRINAVEC